MSRLNIYARSLGASWVGLFANVLVGFFLMRYLINGLDVAVYGLWCLLAQLTGYLGLVDIGVTGSTGRFINYYLGRGDQAAVDGVLNTSLVYYTAISVAVFLAALGLGLAFPYIFPNLAPKLAAQHLDPGLVEQAKWVLLLLAINIWLGFISATFSQLLQATLRFDLKVAAEMIALATRTAGAIWVVSSGGGLVELAVAQVLAGIVTFVFLFIFARWKGPPVRLSWRLANRASFRELFTFGTWAFIGNIAIKLVYATSSTIIGILIGPAAIAVYTVGATLIDYGRSLVGHVTIVMSPDIQQAAGRQDFKDLRLGMTKGIRITMVIAVPLFVGFMVYGTELIRLWQLSPKFAEERVTDAGLVLLILTAAQFFSLATRPCGAVLSGLGYVKFLGLTAIAEGATNIVLSVVFVVVFKWGLAGVALGTLLPMAVNCLFQPIYTCWKIQMNPWR